MSDMAIYQQLRANGATIRCVMQLSRFAVARALALTCTLCVGVANFAQQPGTTSPKSQTNGTATQTRSSDLAIAADAIRESYYHPDDMSDLNCSVSVDWPAFLASTKLNPSAERLKAIQDLKIRSQSIRGNSPNITFEWVGTLDSKEQLENGLKQMLGGFYQMYWSLVATPPIHSAAEITKMESLADGGAQVYSSSQDIKVVITVNKENTPTHYTLDSPTLKGTIDLRYVPAPTPIPGDLRRISSVDVSEHIGTSVINVKLDLDYQAVDGFYVPAHVSYDVGGALSVSMKFSDCSATKGAIPNKIK